MTPPMIIGLDLASGPDRTAFWVHDGRPKLHSGLRWWFTANPFYERAGTVVIEDPATGRRQHFGVWATTTRAEFLRLARHHLKAVRLPLPEWPAEERARLRFVSNRRLADDDESWA